MGADRDSYFYRKKGVIISFTNPNSKLVLAVPYIKNGFIYESFFQAYTCIKAYTRIGKMIGALSSYTH